MASARTWLQLSAIVLLGVVALAGTALVTGLALAQRTAGRPPLATPGEQRVFEATRPAVGFIQVEYDYRTAVRIPALNAAGSHRLAALEATGMKPADSLEAVLSDPVPYLAAGSGTAEEEFFSGGYGSGFFVSQAGRMVTASHVVAPAADDLAAQLKDAYHDRDQLTGVDSDLLGRLAGSLSLPEFTLSGAAARAVEGWLPGYLEVNASQV